jgi:hypothetical protein
VLSSVREAILFWGDVNHSRAPAAAAADLHLACGGRRLSWEAEAAAS